MTDKIIVCAGTRKGLFVFESTKARKTWKMRGPFLKGWAVYHAMVDTRSTASAKVLHSTSRTLSLFDGITRS